MRGKNGIGSRKKREHTTTVVLIFKVMIPVFFYSDTTDRVVAAIYLSSVIGNPGFVIVGLKPTFLFHLREVQRVTATQWLATRTPHFCH